MYASGPVPPSPSLSHYSTSEIVSILSPITHHPGTVPSVFTNWATTFRSQTLATFTPSTVDQVRLIVELSRRNRKELRCAGAGHSPSDIVCTKGYVIDLKGLNELIKVDHHDHEGGGGTFHAQGGIILKNLHPLLARHDLAISSLGSISDQTLAGAISTCTHGSGVLYGSLSSFVNFLDLVLPLPDSPIVRVSRDQDEELFLSALCGLGVVGVIVGVGMKCEENFKLEEECFSMNFKDYLKFWKEIAQSSQHVRCWWFPQIGKVKISRLNRTKKPITTTNSSSFSFIKTWWIEKFFANHFHAVALFVARKFPSLLPYHCHLMWNLVHQPGPLKFSQLFGKIDWPQPQPQQHDTTTAELLKVPEVGVKRGVLKNPPQDLNLLTPPITPPSLSPTQSNESIETTTQNGLPWPILEDSPTYRVDTSIGIFNYDCGFPQYTYESSVPYDSTSDVLTSLNEWHVRELHNPKGYELKAHFPIEIRWTERDDIYLSPCYEQRGTFLGAIQYRPFNLPVAYRSTFSTFASLISLHKGRPHWAKTHTLTPKVLKTLYPKFNVFMKVRERVDPENVLVNGYVRRHLLGQDEQGRYLDGDEGQGQGETDRWEERSREWKVRKLGNDAATEAKVVVVPKESVQMVC